MVMTGSVAEMNAGGRGALWHLERLAERLPPREVFRDRSLPAVPPVTVRTLVPLVGR